VLLNIRIVAKKSYATPHLVDDGDEKLMDVDDDTFKDGPQVPPAS
jgi:hypothetical protein